MMTLNTTLAPGKVSVFGGLSLFVFAVFKYCLGSHVVIGALCDCFIGDKKGLSAHIAATRCATNC